MPSREPVPSVANFVKAGGDAILGSRDKDASVRSGGAYDLIVGHSGVIWSRQAFRDKQLFANNYIDSARGADLDRLVESYFSVSRIQDDWGYGQAIVARPSVAAGAGTLYAGTRIRLHYPPNQPTFYVVRTNVLVGANDLTAVLPVRSDKTGKGVSANAIAPNLSFTDELYDNTFSAVTLVCQDGVVGEKDDEYLARARTSRRDMRPGLIRSILEACHDAGATNVVAMKPGAFGDALNDGFARLYVGDSNYQSTEALKKAIAIALESVRNIGVDIQLMDMTQVSCIASADVTLVDDPGKINTTGILGSITRTISDYFLGNSEWWKYDKSALVSSVLQSHPDVQNVNFALRTKDPLVAVPETPDAFPTIVTRYSLFPGDIIVNFSGPS